MNGSVIRRLVVKDLYLTSPLIVGTLLVSAVALAMLPAGDTAYFVGWVVLLVALVLLGVFTVFMCVIGERKEKVLLFVLSLPVSTTQYVAAKLAALSMAFLVPWAVITASALAVVAFSPIPDGLMPFLAIVLFWPVCYYSLLFTVGLLTDSAVWFTAVIVGCNLAPTFFIPALFRLPSVGAEPAAEAIWAPEALTILGLQAVFCAVVVGLGLFFYLRKKDYV